MLLLAQSVRFQTMNQLSAFESDLELSVCVFYGGMDCSS